MIDQDTLERFKIVLHTYVNEAMVEDFAESPQVNVPWFGPWADEMIAVQIKQAIYGRQAGKWAYLHPRDWWQMLKQRHAPYWFKQRWPVQMSKVVVNVKQLYPRGNGTEPIINVTAYRDGQELWLMEQTDEPLEDKGKAERCG